jgi:16S rRNA (uracil1498-N3)-methyltransferase
VTLPRFLVSHDALEERSTVLTGRELHHLRVRRLRAGSTLVLFDGVGHQRQGIVTALDHRQASIQFLDEALPQAESSLRLVLAQAALKASKLDVVIEKATELGASEVVIFTCERSIQAATAVRTERWARVATSAAKQCQRSTVPRVRGPIRFDHLLREETAALRLFFWEDACTGTLATVAQRHRSCESVLTVVGPEGGFSQHEAARVAAAGFEVIGLAPRVLRAETATIVTLALCQFLWGDLGAAATHQP